LEGDHWGGRREASFGDSAQSKGYAECENEIEPDTDQFSAPFPQSGSDNQRRGFRQAPWNYKNL
jgi:hypothetical protein